MHLLRRLFFYEAHYAMRISASHIAWAHNGLADHLSRNQLSLFLSQAHHSSTTPTPLPLMAQDLLFAVEAKWSSQAWINLLRATLQQV